MSEFETAIENGFALYKEARSVKVNSKVILEGFFLQDSLFSTATPVSLLKAGRNLATSLAPAPEANARLFSVFRLGIFLFKRIRSFSEIPLCASIIIEKLSEDSEMRMIAYFDNP